MSASTPKERNLSLDLIKWLAIITMVIDHLQYVLPNSGYLFVIGRFAFPAFCMAVAANVFRSQRGDLFSDANVRYLTWLVVFATASEVPFRWLATSSSTMNVMPTLAFGLVAAWGFHHRTRDSAILAAVTLAVSLVLHQSLMYGVFGVLLPAAFVVALQYPQAGWLAPAIMAVLANSRNHWVLTFSSAPMALGVLVAAFSAPIACLWLLSRPTHLALPPVKRWGYWFYPLHMLAIKLATQIA
ncbi:MULTISPECIES: TraX family protein [Pseudomonadaceae]|uniref:Membrane protein n=1 Tax=Aquipseudomonas alcaligenes TaxID=43263 RepID=A0AA37FNW6_AQUAC|nr:TraX family protein [Pseudomonas alcaligenes]EKX3868187.1 conjugal transfer protein TraX [Pseudomonas aeruginosa]BCR23440.1 membrane protein [Pseudomonas alcaligenes]GIZ73364.1 membrane protein [Pseudomonas alcaligenes]GIZ77715.1 membrane protein [Pseudomonas alcaligenes]GIZ82059.1 membrane protein [Pseudomonas alcaligenes]